MSSLTIALVGNPNSGKSTLFNALTGARQKVGNWPGVTVEYKTGYFFSQDKKIEIVDLPGIYQLNLSQKAQAIDEKITCEFLLNSKVDLIVNVLDATHLERHLYLTLQLLAMNIPMLVVVNMVDVANRRQMSLDLSTLSKKINCPVVGLVANKGEGLDTLKNQISAHSIEKRFRPLPYHYPEPIKKAIDTLVPLMENQKRELNVPVRWLAEQFLQGYSLDLPSPVLEASNQLKADLESFFKGDLDIIFVNTLYTYAEQVSKETIINKKRHVPWSDRIDKLVLHRFWGIPIFLAVMYSMFFFAINLGGAFQDFFDISSSVLFVEGTTQLLHYCQAPDWLIALLAEGLGRGINTTLSFIPVIGGMFFFLAFLEGSGYMARATVVIDRLMRIVGLPGKSFVPMIIGFGCNVPAILATRTLQHPKDRILTILMSPFMSCGARLAIFAVFTAAFFPVGGQNVVFGLYFIGILAAILTGLLLRKTVLRGNLTPFIMELPAYHMPTLKSLFRQAFQRLNSFIFRAGKLIIPICMLIGMLNTINAEGQLVQKGTHKTSLLSSLGQYITPVLGPLGIKENNWPATVGLITGVLAKEVVVATLNTLYMQEADLSNPQPHASLSKGLKEALRTIPNNVTALKDAFRNPVLASVSSSGINHQVYGVMYERFGNKTAAFAYLLFVLLYFPCVSATAVMAKELNKQWAIFSVVWSTALAYAISTSFFQLATFKAHSGQAILWLIFMATIFSIFFFLMRRIGLKKKDEGGNETSPLAIQNFQCGLKCAQCRPVFSNFLERPIIRKNKK